MPDRSLLLAAYLSRFGDQGDVALADMPARPQGSVIWVRAADASQLDALHSLQGQLQAEGDQIHLIVTLPEPDGTALQTPQGHTQINGFLMHWQPDLMLWLDPVLDPNTLFALAKSAVPCILLGAGQDTLRPVKKTWVPGVAKAMLRQFVLIMAPDDAARSRFVRAGADPKRMKTLGVLESAPAALTHNEQERQEITQVLGARSIWFAADTDVTEITAIAQAHHQASRRAHRLLLIISLRDHTQGQAATALLREAGFGVAQRSAEDDVDEATQVYVADTPDELGLWYRIAPITYLGGSLSGGPCRDPFEAATLGSAVLHGPDVAPFEAQVKRLDAADACVPVASFADLGQQVETLLSPDKTALIVHAAWDVTSRGADVTNKLADAIFAQLDAGGS